MSIHEFSKKIAEAEGLKEQVNIAQIKEILSVINKLIPFGLFYGVIKLLR